MTLEKKIIHLLKLKGPLSPNDIAQKLNISKTCAYSHIASLEEKHFLQKKLIKTKVGRPGYKFILTERGNNSLNEEGCYVGDLLHFMIKTENQNIISDFLKNMYSDIMNRYETVIPPGNVAERAEHLVTLREGDGYMATLVRHSDSEIRIEQANCPIYKMAKLDHSACELERNMFGELLGKEVSISQKQTKGFGTCRFHIKVP